MEECHFKPIVLLTGLTVDDCRKHDNRLKDKLWFVQKEQDDIFLIEISAVVPGFKETLVVMQESGIQPGEPHITEIIPLNDVEIGQEIVAKLNSNTDLPYSLAKVIMGRPHKIS